MQEEEKFTKIVFRRIVILKNFLLSGCKIIVARPYWKDKQIMAVLFSSVLLNVFIWVFLLQNQKENTYPIILHYNLFFGVDYLGDYEKIYLIPLSGLIIIIINLILGHLLYLKEKLAAYFLVFIIFIIQIFLLINSYLIIKINS
ncbi:hypothetical protein KAI56_03585 [Candidatus Parcubacteria bacterium]|nr:hypothetical protein [Candidatus Parcubacteria bacterium]